MDIREEELNKRVDRADHIIKYALFFMGLAISVMLTVVIYLLFAVQHQIADSIQSNYINGSANHKRTQSYIKCVAVTLTIPIDQRTTNALDECTKDADQATTVKTSN